MSKLLEVLGLRKRFGGVYALDGLSLRIEQGEIVGIIGPNGAGKTTLLNCLTGMVKPDSGYIYLNGRAINGLPPHKIAREGVSRTYQVPRPFRRLTVLESVLTAVASRGLSFSIEHKERALSLLDFVGLYDKKDDYAGELSGGQERLLEFARALMSSPRLVLMDEPFAGVFPEIKEKLISSVKKVNEEEGKTFIVVSHDMTVIARLCNRVIAMHLGRALAEGKPKEVLADKKIVETYLGA